MGNGQWARVSEFISPLMKLSQPKRELLYPKGIPKNIVSCLTQLYEQIIKRGLSFHSSQSPLTSKGNRGRVKRRIGHNLLLRLSNFQGDVLRFLTEPDVSFTNNQAERDLRMMKCKQKISGGFRSFDFAVSFANICSFISTASNGTHPIFWAEKCLKVSLGKGITSKI